ncbi:SMR family transporter [Methyloversatilis sp. NSM2]
MREEALGLKCTGGCSRFRPSAFTVVTMIISVVPLGIAMRNLPVGSACAMGTGIGRNRGHFLLPLTRDFAFVQQRSPRRAASRHHVTALSHGWA